MDPDDGSAPDQSFGYDAHPSGVVDLHLPGGSLPDEPASVVLVVHGGFWKEAYDRTHTRPQARALADLGHVVATPEYRRVGDGPGGGGGWPATGSDVRRALEAVLAQLPWRPARLTAMGHSAGGHLALWLAASGAPLDHVVALAPVCDLREATRQGLGDDATQALLGDADLATADPMTLLDDRPGCTVTVVHGRDDEPVPIGLSRGLVARHPWIALDEVAGGHMELIDPGSASWPHVVRALDAG